MGTFTASLRNVGDVRSLPATVELSDGRLSIAANNTDIGSWALTDIHLEPIPTGYRMAAEGDQILIELKDLVSFEEELQNASKRKRSFGLRRKKTTEAATDSGPTNNIEVKTRPEPERKVEPSAGSEPAARVEPQTRPESPRDAEPRPRSEPRVVLPKPRTSPPPQPSVAEPRPEPGKKVEKTGFGGRIIEFVDRTLDQAHKRFGPYLPEWMFTRAMFAIAFAALVLLILLPGLVSVFLLIAGALLILLGAVAYSDPVLASRWLPGRTSPPQVLLFGVAILMMGVLLGVIVR